MLAVTLAAAVLVGVSLGALGGGGSILTVPLLVYLAGMDASEAITTSLFVVAVTSVVALVSHARAGRVDWRTGVVFGLAGMVGAYGGGRLATHVPGNWLLVGFGAVMVAAAVAMIRGRRGDPSRSDAPDRRGTLVAVSAGASAAAMPSAVSVAATAAFGSDEREPGGPVRPVAGPAWRPWRRSVVQGAAVGVVTGLVGAGGGFVIVPALTLLAGLPMASAVGTSLAVITMNSTAGLVGHLASAHITWSLALAVTAAAVVGSLFGSRLVRRIRPNTLRRGFGWFVLAMGAVVLAQRVPPLPAVGGVALVAVSAATRPRAVLAGVLGSGWARIGRRRMSRTS